MAIELPPGLSPSKVVFSKAMVSRSGGRSITGSEQVVSSHAGFWRASLTIPVRGVGRRGEEATLAYRGLYAALDGMAGEVLVPLYTRWRPYGHLGKMLSVHSASGFESAGMLHDHSGFGQTEPQVMFAEGAAVRGSTRITITHPGVPALRPGHYFGIGNRLYLVARAWVLDYERGLDTTPTLTYDGRLVTDAAAELTYTPTQPAIIGTNRLRIEFWPI